jgi:hypothetical protein
MSTAFWTLVPAKSLDDLPLETIPELLRPPFDDLMLQVDFLDAITMGDQVGFSYAFLHPPGSTKKVSDGNTALFFHINKGSVFNYWNRYPEQANTFAETIITTIDPFHLSLCLKRDCITFSLKVCSSNHTQNDSMSISSLTPLSRR